MVLCLTHNTYSKWEGHCPSCERERKAQEKEVKKAEAALKADKEKKEAEAMMKEKKTKKTGKPGKKLLSRFASGWADRSKKEKSQTGNLGKTFFYRITE